MTSKQVRHIDDPDVQDSAEKAAERACTVLDAMFPGFDGGGITSNFHGHLKGVLLRMLAGHPVLAASLGATQLPELVLTDASFGEPLIRGELFLVARYDGNEWAADTSEPSGRRWVPRVVALGEAGFVPLNATERIDTHAGFGAAVQSAVRWLRNTGAPQDEARLFVASVSLDGETYVLSPAAQGARFCG